jgi:hypothetical protein
MRQFRSFPAHGIGYAKANLGTVLTLWMTRSPGLGRTVPGRSIRLTPLQRLWQIAASVFNMQHPAVPATLRTTGRVQQQRSYNQRSPTFQGIPC